MGDSGSPLKLLKTRNFVGDEGALSCVALQAGQTTKANGAEQLTLVKDAER